MNLIFDYLPIGLTALFTLLTVVFWESKFRNANNKLNGKGKLLVVLIFVGFALSIKTQYNTSHDNELLHKQLASIRGMTQHIDTTTGHTDSTANVIDKTTRSIDTTTRSTEKTTEHIGKVTDHVDSTTQDTRDKLTGGEGYPRLQADVETIYDQPDVNREKYNLNLGLFNPSSNPLHGLDGILKIDLENGQTLIKKEIGITVLGVSPNKSDEQNTFYDRPNYKPIGRIQLEPIYSKYYVSLDMSNDYGEQTIQQTILYQKLYTNGRGNRWYQATRIWSRKKKKFIYFHTDGDFPESAKTWSQFGGFPFP